MTASIKIDFVSDVSCPWCVIGLRSLETALSQVADEVAADIHFQPFELNPQMSPQGEDTGEYIARKYGSSAEQIADAQEMIRARGAELGFEFRKRGRIYNTFDAHRLLHWAEGPVSKKTSTTPCSLPISPRAATSATIRYWRMWPLRLDSMSTVYTKSSHRTNMPTRSERASSGT